MNMLSEIHDMVAALAGCEYLYFDDPVKVKRTPHDENEVRLWAISVSPSKKVYVMDNTERWHEVEEKDSNVIASLYQRMKLLTLHYKKAS